MRISGLNGGLNRATAIICLTSWKMWSSEFSSGD